MSDTDRTDVAGAMARLEQSVTAILAVDRGRLTHDERLAFDRELQSLRLSLALLEHKFRAEVERRGLTSQV